MKRFCIAAALLALTTSAGLAGSLADPPVEPMVPAPAPQPAFNWTGAYAGLGLGLMNQRDTAPPGGFVLAPARGGELSALIGYNWQGDSAFVFGGEAMIATGRVRGAEPCSNPVFECRSSVGSTAALRLRLGVAQDRTLFFITAGVAQMSVTHSTELQPSPGLTSVRRGRSAATLGIGIEHAMAGNWNIRGDIETYRLRGGTYILDNNLDYSPARGNATAARLTLVRRF